MLVDHGDEAGFERPSPGAEDGIVRTSARE